MQHSTLLKIQKCILPHFLSMVGVDSQANQSLYKIVFTFVLQSQL